MKRFNTPVKDSTGRYFPNMKEAAKYMETVYGLKATNDSSIYNNIYNAITNSSRTRTAYGLKWDVVPECTGCDSFDNPDVCPIKWTRAPGKCQKGDGKR